MRSLRVSSAIAAAVLAGILGMPLVSGAGIAAVTDQRGWSSHSAYGLQLSIPKSWAVAYFQNCPVKDAGTLLIGAPDYLSNCTFVPSDANVMWMQPEGVNQTFSGPGRHLVLNGIAVTSYPNGISVVPSRRVVLLAMGPRSEAVLHTLTVATSRAEAAPGMLKGSEYLVALEKTPVTGPVTVTRLGPRRVHSAVVQAFDAQYWHVYPPGRYQLTGHAGDAPCPPQEVNLQSGRSQRAPEIDCQGE